MDYVCAVTGSLADDLLPLTETGPLGWVKVTLERQVPNPEYLQLQQLKASMVEQQFDAVKDQLPEGDEQAEYLVRLNIELQIQAMFIALEKEMDEYNTQYEEVFLSPPEADEDVAEILSEFRDAVGLTEDAEEDEDDEDEAEDEGAEEEAAEEGA